MLSSVKPETAADAVIQISEKSTELARSASIASLTLTETSASRLDRTILSRRNGSIASFTSSRSSRMWLHLSPIFSSTQPISTRSEEHTSELQSLMRISYAVFCLKKKNKNKDTTLIRYA